MRGSLLRMEGKTQFQDGDFFCVLSLALISYMSQVVFMNPLVPASCSVVLFLFQLFYIAGVYLHKQL